MFSDDQRMIFEERRRSAQLRREETIQARLAITAAAAAGDREQVKRLLDLGFTTNLVSGELREDHRDVDLLSRCIRLDQLNEVKRLVSEGATPVRREAEPSAGDPLVIAAIHNRLEILRFLWEASQDDQYRYLRRDAVTDRDAYPRQKGPLGSIATDAAREALINGNLDAYDFLVNVCGATPPMNFDGATPCPDFNWCKHECIRTAVERFAPKVVELFDLVLKKDYARAIPLIEEGVTCTIVFPFPLFRSISALGLALLDRDFPADVITLMIQKGNSSIKGSYYAMQFCCDDRPLNLLRSLGEIPPSQLVKNIIDRPRTGRMSGERLKLLTALGTMGIAMPA